MWRLPLATSVPTSTLVACEHLIIVLLLSPMLPRAWRAFARCSGRERLAVLFVGAGSSALATVLFTTAFTYGDPVTPVVLQKLQPIFAALASFLLLRERLRGGYLAFVVPALAGAWLLAFSNPFEVRVSQLAPAMLALGAAVLWAGGTVFGRMLSRSLSAVEVTTLRFSVGLPTAALVVLLRGDPVAVGWANLDGVFLLALIPGLLALSLYYLGLRTTPAARATLAELSFPATAAIVGVWILGEDMSITQWIGFLLIVGVVTGMGLNERNASRTVVDPSPVPVAK